MGLGKKESTPQSTTQTQKVEPWAGQAPYLQDLFARAQAQSQTGGPQFYPGQLVAPQSGATQEAQRTMMGLGTGLQPAAQTGLNMAMFDMGAGRDIASNPFLASAMQSAINPLLQNFTSVGGPLAQIRGHFTAANSGGSGTREGIAMGVAQRGLQQQVGDITSNMAFNAYQQAQEQALRQQALLPQTLQAAAFPATLMGQVGAQQDAYAQSLINAEIERHNYNQQLPWLQLQNYGNLIGGNYGSTSTGTTTAPGPRTNPLMQGLGGAATGGALASMLKLPVPGIGWAAGIGGLLGLLG